MGPVGAQGPGGVRRREKGGRSVQASAGSRGACSGRSTRGMALGVGPAQQRAGAWRARQGKATQDEARQDEARHFCTPRNNAACCPACHPRKMHSAGYLQGAENLAPSPLGVEQLGARIQPHRLAQRPHLRRRQAARHARAVSDTPQHRPGQSPRQRQTLPARQGRARRCGAQGAEDTAHSRPPAPPAPAPLCSQPRLPAAGH